MKRKLNDKRLSLPALSVSLVLTISPYVAILILNNSNSLIQIFTQARQLTFAVTSVPDKPGFPSFDTTEPKPYTPTTQIMFPVFFLYPQHSTSDFISQFAEHTTFADQLANMFPVDGHPPEWDRENREYVVGKLVVYVITRLGRLLKVGSKMSLAEAFLRAGVMIEQGGKQVQDGLELRDGCLSFAVVPKGDVEKWYVEDFKKKKGARGKSS